MIEIGLQTLFLAAGFILLVKGADWFVDGAAGLAEKFRIPQLVIGLTIVAMGTSMPEAAVSISAAMKGNADITIGNVMGSNILNILIILGLSAAITPLAVETSTIWRDLPFLILVTALLFILGLDGIIGTADGTVLLLLFTVYLAGLLIMTKLRQNTAVVHLTSPRPLQQALQAPPPAAETTDGEASGSQGQKSWPLLLLLTAAGLSMIVAGSSVTVEAASSLARIFGISERFIGLTIVALGTSLPELFTSVTAARKRNADIAIGNVVGSNIFNLLFVTGASALVMPVPYKAAFLSDNLISGAASLMLLFCSLRERKLLRRHGTLMLLGYAVYFVTLL
ncbi:MAG: calcium/sodium antiporter [Lachnospiraceae bacterium]|nr:calcium/sodium antiporter [Lachnospiraceae bacterium]